MKDVFSLIGFEREKVKTPSQLYRLIRPEYFSDSTTEVEKMTEEGAFRVLAMSSVWNKEKGLYDIFKLRELLPDNYQITIVGLTAKQVDGLPSGIKGIQRTQHVQELVQLYSDADVLINPTYADSFPTVNLEALACGTPLVTYRTGGSPEAISDDTGWVVEQGDTIVLAASVENVCSKGKPHFVEACRKRAEAYFDKDKCFEKYVRLYGSLMAHF